MSRSSVVRVLTWIALAGVFGGLLMPLVFIKEVIFPFVFSKLVVFQILIGLTFPAYLLLAWMEPQYRPKKHPLLSAIGAYFLAMGLSVVFSVDPLRSWWGNQERMNGFFTLLHFLAWLVMMVSLLRTWVDWERFLRFQAFAGGAVALTGIWQRWVNPEVFLYRAGDRVGGVLDNPIYMGMYQMFAFFILALLAVKTRSKAWWAAYGALALLGVAGFAASQSRGPLVGLFVGIVAFALFYGISSKERRDRIVAASLVGAGILGYGALYLARGTEIVQRLRLDRFVDFSSTASTRLIAWKIAWQSFLERPLFGWGLDAFHIVFNTHYNPVSLRFSLYETWFDRAHNTVLDVLAMTGVLGFLTYAAIFAVLFWSVYRAYKKGWLDHAFASILIGLPVAYFVQNLFVFDHPAGFVLSYLMFGLVIAATRPGFLAGTVPEESVVSRKFPMAAAVPLVLLALLLVWRASILPFQASVLTIRASQLFGRADGLAALESAMKISTPYRDEQLFLLSRALIGAGANLPQVPDWQKWLEIAKAAGQQEVDRHPKNSYARYIYARLLADTSSIVPAQVPAAEEQYRFALEYSPNRQQLYEGLSQLYLRHNRVDDALQQIKRIQEADPENGYGDWLAGVVILFDQRRETEGANLILGALEKPYPFVLGTNRELVPVFNAYRVLGRGADLDRWAARVKEDPAQGETPFYQLAYQARLAKRTDLEKRLIAQAERLFPGSEEKYLSSVIQLESEAPVSVSTEAVVTSTVSTTRR